MRSTTFAAIGIVALAGVVAGCSSTRVHTDYNPRSDFRHLRTYMWIDQQSVMTTQPAMNGALVTERVQNAVDGQLVARGFRRLTSGTPDFWVAYHIIATDKTEIITDDGAYGYYGRYYNRSIYTLEFVEGTLVIDVIDAETNKVMWRGWATKALDDDPNPDAVAMYVKRAVKKILKNFPPTT